MVFVYTPAGGGKGYCNAKYVRAVEDDIDGNVIAGSVLIFGPGLDRIEAREPAKVLGDRLASALERAQKQG